MGEAESLHEEDGEGLPSWLDKCSRLGESRSFVLAEFDQVADNETHNTDRRRRTTESGAMNRKLDGI